jgi:hypothetical protein
LNNCKKHPKVLEKKQESVPCVWGEEELVVKGYIDASFQTDTDDSKS